MSKMVTYLTQCGQLIDIGVTVITSPSAFISPVESNANIGVIINDGKTLKIIEY